MRIFEEFEIEIESEEPVFPTTVVCKLLNIPRWVLRELDKESIVSPPRKKNRARLYSKKQLKKLNFVWHLIDEKGVNFKGVKVILQMKEKQG